MNNARRAALRKAIEQIETAIAQVEAEAEAEREGFENMPESLQEGERGQAMSDANELAEIEECMRKDVFHSTLDWQTRAELHRGALIAEEVLETITVIPRRERGPS